MKANWESRPAHVELRHRANGTIIKQMGVSKRMKVVTLNSHLICVLCSGYYVEATALVECLHTFCRSCIVKYLQSNNFCPICDVQIHQAKPWSSLRSDKTLQDLVYKLVPGLYQDEMRRRRQFYCRLGKGAETAEGEEGGFLPQGARFFSQDDSISLSLEYYNGQEEDEELGLSKAKLKQISEKPKRYLQCPAAVTVRHLKKFLRMKYGIGLDCWVDIIYNDECLPENFSLIDVAYTFAWKRTSPMKFSYRIFCKAIIRAVRPQGNIQTSRTDEGEGKRSRHQSTLEQQMQNEYLGNFNLNPTNSGFCKSQNYSKTKNNCTNNNNNAVKTNNTSPKEKRDDFYFRAYQETEEVSKDKLSQSSEDSYTSGLRIVSEKEESVNGNSEDSKDSVLLDEKRRRTSASVPNFAEETVDSFTAKKLLKNKHKWEEKRKKLESSRGEKRRKSAGNAEESEEAKTKSVVSKRRKTIADEFSLQREMGGKGLRAFSVGNEDEDIETLGNLKNEALRKVFVTKDKPENNNKRKDGDGYKKKRKKSKHHEGETKKRKLEMIPSSPAIMSIAKDALKLKVKLNPSKPLVLSSSETIENPSQKESEAASEKSLSKSGENDNKKVVTDKERLLHLRAVRHKSTVNKGNLKDYINAPPSLTISKVDSSEQQPVKTTLVESKPSLEIMLVSPNSNNNNNNNNSSSSSNSGSSSSSSNSGSSSSSSNSNSSSSSNCSSSSGSNNNNNNSSSSSSNNNNNNNNNNNSKNNNTSKNNNNNNSDHSKLKGDTTAEPVRETVLKKVESLAKEGRRSEVVDNFGVLDLSEKSTRTKENSSNLSSSKDTSETVEKCRKSTHQSIMQIAQNLVNRKLSPVLPKNSLKGVLESAADSSVTAAAMRNLKTLSDTAVNILMAAQNKSFSTDSLKRSYSFMSTPSQTPSVPPNSAKSSNDFENGSGLKIPIYPVSRDRMHPIPPVPNLHEIYPRGRGRSATASRPSTPVIKPGQNQTVRQIPNPFAVINRQGSQNSTKPPSPKAKTENNEDAGSKQNKFDSTPALQNTNLSLPALDDLPELTSEKKSNDFKSLLTPKNINNNLKTVQNGSEGSAFTMKSEERKGVIKLSCSSNSVRKIENMAKNIESVAAGLTARAVSNAMIDAK